MVPRQRSESVRPELVKRSLIVSEEPSLRELPLSIDLHRLCHDDIKGLAVAFGDGAIEGDNVIVTGKDRFYLGVLRAPCLDDSGQRIHHRVSSAVRAAHGVVPGKVHDGIFRKVLPEDIQTAAVPRLSAPPRSGGSRMFSHCRPPGTVSTCTCPFRTALPRYDQKASTAS